MRKILKSLVPILFVSILSSCATGAKSPSWVSEKGMSGGWQGKYTYKNRKSVPFRLKIISEGGDHFRGISTEPNTYGDKSATVLTADLEGMMESDGKFHFSKKMDGSGGQTHTIEYSGEVKTDGVSASGIWKTSEKLSGKFEMKRD